MIALAFPLPTRRSVRTPAAEYDPATQSVTGTIIPADSTGRLVRYQVTLESAPDTTGLATLSPAVREVQLDIPATYVPVVSSPAIEIEAQIAEIEEHQWFDPSTLTVHTEVGINLDNTHGPYPLLGSAHVAALYSRGLTIDGVGANLFPLVTGWAGFSATLTRADPTRRFDLVLADRSWQLRRSPVGALPYFDGWCFLAAMRFLANTAGVTDDALADPLTSCEFGTAPANCPHMRLAQVQGERSRVRFPVDYDVWHAICEVASYAGGVVGFDANGVLRVAPHADLLTTTPYRGTFTTTDVGDPGDLVAVQTAKKHLRQSRLFEGLHRRNGDCD